LSAISSMIEIGFPILCEQRKESFPHRSPGNGNLQLQSSESLVTETLADRSFKPDRCDEDAQAAPFHVEPPAAFA
jgi:hypothetical protein